MQQPIYRSVTRREFLQWVGVSASIPLLAACTCPGPSSQGGAAPAGEDAAVAPACPYSSVTVSGPPSNQDVTLCVPNEVTSVTIPQDCAWTPSGDIYLEIQKVDVAQLVSRYGCPNDQYEKEYTNCVYNMLAAVDLKPEKLNFPDVPRPILRYDLDKNHPLKDSSIYKIYQLKGTIPPPPQSSWLPVGWAKEGSYDGYAVAESTSAGISHFSIFALVELPPPTPVPPGTMVAIIASDFLANDSGAITVALQLIELGINLPANLEETRIFSFQGIDPTDVDTWNIGQCDLQQEPAAYLSCIFPIGSQVEITFDSGIVTITSISSEGYMVTFYASNVQIY